MRRNIRTSAQLLAITAAVALSSLAKADEVVLGHTWNDYYGNKRSLSIPFDESRVRQALTASRDLHGYKTIYRSIMNHAKIFANNVSNQDIKARVVTSGLDYKVEVQYRPGLEGEADKLVARIDDFILGSYDDLRPVTYYRYDPKFKALLMNYADIAHDYEDVFAASHRYFQSTDAGKSEVEQINDRLAFLQSIPYDDMLSNDFDLNTPIRMLAEGRGDCESKQIYMAGLLGNLFPGRQVHLVLLPNKEHVLLALEVDGPTWSETYTHEGRRYLILDATGPGQSPVQATREVRDNLNFDYGQKVWNRIY